MGTSGVQRCALLLETTGVSVFRVGFLDGLRISSLVISTALNTKSTAGGHLLHLVYIHATISFFTASGMGVSIFQRPPTASS